MTHRDDSGQHLAHVVLVEALEVGEAIDTVGNVGEQGREERHFEDLVVSNHLKGGDGVRRQSRRERGVGQSTTGGLIRQLHSGHGE